MQFREYLVSKKIDENSFKGEEPLLFQSLANEFDQLHPESFTAQKLFLINPLRRRFPLTVPSEEKPKA